MNEDMILKWNSVVTPEDQVYHVGDFAFGTIEERRSIFNRLNGQKCLIRGNHDESRSKALAVGWYAALPSLVILVRGEPILLQHRPVDVFTNGLRFNVHGHIHDRPPVSERHINVSVEQMNYTPRLLEELIYFHTHA